MWRNGITGMVAAGMAAALAAARTSGVVPTFAPVGDAPDVTPFTQATRHGHQYGDRGRSDGHGVTARRDPDGPSAPTA